MKKVLLITLGAVVALPIMLYISITMINDGIAKGVEKELRAVTLPGNVELIDSLSAAGKFGGNGNGMQYFGAILVSGDITEEELENHYGKYIEYVEVKKQETETVFEYGDVAFDDYDSGTDCYMVSAWGYVDGEFLSELLNVDLRGH